MWLARTTLQSGKGSLVATDGCLLVVVEMRAGEGWLRGIQGAAGQAASHQTVNTHHHHRSWGSIWDCCAWLKDATKYHPLLPGSCCSQSFAQEFDQTLSLLLFVPTAWSLARQIQFETPVCQYLQGYVMLDNSGKVKVSMARGWLGR